MNWIDLLLVLILFLSAWSGWHKGLILGLIDLATWAGSLLAGFFFYPYMARLLQKPAPSLGIWLLPLAFILTIIIARLLLSLLLGTLTAKIDTEVHRSEANRFLGILPGVANGVINAALVAILLLSLPLSAAITNQARESRLVARVTPAVEWVEAKLEPVFDRAVRETMTKLTVEPDSKETVPLPYKVANPKVRPDLEAEMLQLLNEERSKAGLKPVVADPELTLVARAHSADMFARGYFSHYTPEHKTPFDRMRAANIRFLVAGENLALAKTLSIAHTGLMNSPGHRANILNPAFGRLGIGILDGGFYGLMISQEFRN
jgi:uncharacterized protein YkwD